MAGDDVGALPFFGRATEFHFSMCTVGVAVDRLRGVCPFWVSGSAVHLGSRTGHRARSIAIGAPVFETLVALRPPCAAPKFTHRTFRNVGETGGNQLSSMHLHRNSLLRLGVGMARWPVQPWVVGCHIWLWSWAEFGICWQGPNNNRTVRMN